MNINVAEHRYVYLLSSTIANKCHMAYNKCHLKLYNIIKLIAHKNVILWCTKSLIHMPATFFTLEVQEETRTMGGTHYSPLSSSSWQKSPTLSSPFGFSFFNSGMVHTMECAWYWRDKLHQQQHHTSLLSKKSRL